MANRIQGPAKVDISGNLIKGAAGGAAAGAAIGAPIGGVGAIPGALIGGGIGFLGGAISSFGESRANKADIEQDEKDRLFQEEQNRLDRILAERNADQQGLALISQQQDSARNNSRFRSFRNQLLGRGA